MSKRNYSDSALTCGYSWVIRRVVELDISGELLALNGKSWGIVKGLFYKFILLSPKCQNIFHYLHQILVLLLNKISSFLLYIFYNFKTILNIWFICHIDFFIVIIITLCFEYNWFAFTQYINFVGFYFFLNKNDSNLSFSYVIIKSQLENSITNIKPNSYYWWLSRFLVELENIY